jgi:hypothetical protein
LYSFINIVNKKKEIIVKMTNETVKDKKSKSEQIVGSFKITSTFIGEGSTGKVMLAYHLITGQTGIII